MRIQKALDALRGSRIGISRFGSGSHIIPFVLAHQRGWVKKDGEEDAFFKFVELKDIKGLKGGVMDGSVDAFLWERFTTKPYYDSGELHHYANVTPPWPAFLFAARTDLLLPSTTPSVLNGATATARDALRHFLTSVTTSTALFTDAITRDPVTAASALRSTYPFLSAGLGEEDLVKWMETVEYPETVGKVQRGVVEGCVEILGMAGVVGGGWEGLIGGDGVARMCGGEEGGVAEIV
ncbi:hypothetical protein BC829DRAFT_363570 [Chytridium lagenaria]|nr:hypothetical protein BC829DRAFT_363570 [Chytridium lagenaria]